MPALNYQARFAEKVASGEKRQTVRAMRKRPFAVGDVLYHYTGMRTKACLKLGDDICTSARPVLIDNKRRVFVDETQLPGGSVEGHAFATADGFDCMADMLDWFEETHGLPFVGQVISW